MEVVIWESHNFLKSFGSVLEFVLGVLDGVATFLREAARFAVCI